MTMALVPPFSCVVIGNESLLVQCSEILLTRGYEIRAVVSENPDIIRWAQSKNLTTVSQINAVQDVPFDWLFSIANLQMIPEAFLANAQMGAVNFHDGPLPRYAGLNAPVWALLNREKQHGITWHLMQKTADKGDIVEQQMFDISPDETALTLNTKCFAAAIDSFTPMLEKLETGNAAFTPQDYSKRRYFGKFDRPKAAGRLDFSLPAEALVALVRGLDHGTYWNPLTCPKIELSGDVFAVGSAELARIKTTGVETGYVQAVSTDSLEIVTGSGAIKLSQIVSLEGQNIILSDVVTQTATLPSLSRQQEDQLTGQAKDLAKQDGYWRKQLQGYHPVLLPFAEAASDAPVYQQLGLDIQSPDHFLPLAAGWAARSCGETCVDLAFSNEVIADKHAYQCQWVPVRFDTSLGEFSACADAFTAKVEQAQNRGGVARDLMARDPTIGPLKTPDVGFAPTPIIGSCLTFALGETGVILHYDTRRITLETAQRLAAQLEHLAANTPAGTSFNDLQILPAAERKQVLYQWNNTQTASDDCCIHHLFEKQVAKTPDAVALVFEANNLTYRALNARANQAASVLRDMGIKPGAVVGLCVPRSLDMIIGALAIQKAGAAYVPMDPTYPQDRIAHFISDSGAAVILANAAVLANLPNHSAQVLALDTDSRIDAAPIDNIDSGVTPTDLAYMIYTSGSTGLPKGVMVEHRNVSNFFTGMDQQINHSPPGVWMAVTSLSFDISVLELFYTLARGFKVILNSDESRVMASGNGVAISDQKMAFSLFNWGNDNWEGANKYELLLEGAKFADANGFCAVWTPERHFHAFGGLYPNPSVTGAAIAAVTKNIAVRAGSIVAPLHHPIRIAEEWAVIDNMTNGRVGLAIASGWHPNDFVLRPENTPPNNRPAMFEAIKTIRQLWAGAPVEFPDKDGNPVPVTTHPRPLSKTLPMWVTTAGNPQTWRDAGTAGAHVLTHLLGQSIDEVEEKTTLYHTALREAGYDPAEFTVTLMLHTYVGETREEARRIAREPMKSYLRSAAGLIKQYAWAFPAFKKPEGVSNPFELDLESLSADEMEGILDFAFERYFEDSGLFGTIEDCLARVEQLKKIGVTEVACLVDYGLPVDMVLEGLKPLAEVVRRANIATAPASDDFSIAAQIIRHGVTHLQCTPSMGRILLADTDCHLALGKLQHLLIGGEALPGAMVADFAKITKAPISNMYGPTETTIWSSTELATPNGRLVNIGHPIANTQLYVLDEVLRPNPIGVAGELFIGGAGVTRGYWNRPELTAEHFLDNPFAEGRLYRTGDLVSRRPDGRIDFIGRVDTQIKLRGHRIELGEIECCLETHSHVSQAVATVRDVSPGDARLIAYLLTDKPVAETELRDLLNSRLPDFMVPSHFVMLDTMPLTPNKKVDRNALPAPQLAKSTLKPKGHVAPESSVESNIAAIWGRILGVEKIGGSDNFFDLGGHSLLAVQAHREIKAALNVPQLSITDIFRFPVLTALAKKITGDTISCPKNPVPQAAQPAQQRNVVMAKRRAMRARRGGGL